jgi:hypothetical protein
MINVSCHSRPCHQVAKAPGAVKLLMRPEGGGLPWGSVQPLTVCRLASAYFYTLSALHAKPRCTFDESTPCVTSSTIGSGSSCLSPV